MLSYAPRIWWKQAIQSCRNIPWFRPLKINVRILFCPLLTGSQILESFSNIIDLSSAQFYFFRQMFHPCRWCWVDCQSSALSISYAEGLLQFRVFFLINLRTPSPHSASVMNDPASWAILIPLLLWSWEVWHPLTKAKKAKRKEEARAWALGATRGLVWDEEQSPFVKRMYPAKMGSVIGYSWQISSRIDSSKCELLLHGFAPK